MQDDEGRLVNGISSMFQSMGHGGYGFPKWYANKRNRGLLSDNYVYDKYLNCFYYDDDDY